jgi:hypothetical protein
LSDPDSDKAAMLARGRLSEAKKWFAHKGWDVLPRAIRGRRILLWGACQAYLAGPANPKRSCRNWCRRWWPTLTPAELDRIVARTVNSNKRWSADQCAAILEITVRDREIHAFRFIGANDDPNYEHRLKAKRKKNAEYSRKYRAAHSSGRPRGRPKSEGVPAWKAAGFSSERSYYRHKAHEPQRLSGSKNVSRDISKNRKRDGISLPPLPRDSATEFHCPDGGKDL